MKKVSIFGRRVLVAVGAGASALASAVPSYADLLTATDTAIKGAATQAGTVGEYVIAGVCLLIGIPLVIAMLKKLS